MSLFLSWGVILAAILIAVLAAGIFTGVLYLMHNRSTHNDYLGNNLEQDQEEVPIDPKDPEAGLYLTRRAREQGRGKQARTCQGHEGVVHTFGPPCSCLEIFRNGRDVLRAMFKV